MKNGGDRLREGLVSKIADPGGAVIVFFPQKKLISDYNIF